MNTPITDLQERWQYTDRETEILAALFNHHPPAAVRRVVDHAITTCDATRLGQPTVERLRHWLEDGIPNADRRATPQPAASSRYGGQELPRDEALLCWRAMGILMGAPSRIKFAEAVRSYMDESSRRGHRWDESTINTFGALYARFAAQEEVLI